MKFVVVIACLLLPWSTAAAELPSGPDDFPQWRGPNRDGISADKGLLKEWPENGPAVAWQVDDVGVGYSSVAIKDDLIVTMGDLFGVEHIIALRVADGSRVWAVQPAPVAAALDAKVDQEFANLDQNQDGIVDEVEALSRIGWDFHKYDRDDSPGNFAVRAQAVVAGLDANGDGQLDYSEAGNQFGDQFMRIDSADQSKTAELAAARASELIQAADADKDGQVSRQESRANYLGRIFSKADEQLPGAKEGDQLLTRGEIIAYLSKREAGQDGFLTTDELTSFYERNINSGDGKLNREELKSLYGGYRNGQGDGPRGTPTIDGDRVYAEGGNGDLTCLDLRSGKTIWYTSLTQDLGGTRPGWGYSESPLVVDDLVMVTPGGDQGTLAALNRDRRSRLAQQRRHRASTLFIPGRRNHRRFASSRPVCS